MDAQSFKGLPVRVTLLGPAENEFPAIVEDLSGKIMTLALERPVAAGSPLKVESADTLWLGEARACAPDERGVMVHVELIHALYDLPGLARLAERFTAKPHKSYSGVREQEPSAVSKS